MRMQVLGLVSLVTASALAAPPAAPDTCNSVELVDAGATGGVGPLAEKLKSLGYAVLSQTTARDAHVATEMFVHACTDGRAAPVTLLARELGLAPAAVKHADWSSKAMATVVVVGALSLPDLRAAPGTHPELARGLGDALLSKRWARAEALYAEGATVDLPDPTEHEAAFAESPLEMMVRLDHLDAVEWLLKHGADPARGAPKAKRALEVAIEAGLVAEAKALVVAKPLAQQKPARDGWIELAAGQKDPALVSLVLDAGEPVEGHGGGWTPLATAAGNSTLEVVKLLVARGAKVDAGAAGVRPVERAVCARKVDTVKFLLAQHADLHGLGYVSGDNPALTPLLQAGYQPLARDSEGTPLLTECHDPAVMKLLLDRGIDPNLADPADGWTALHEAATTSAGAEIQLLLARGAHPAAKTTAAHDVTIPGDPADGLSDDEVVTVPAGSTARDVARLLSNASATKLLESAR